MATKDLSDPDPTAEDMEKELDFDIDEIMTDLQELQEVNCLFFVSNDTVRFVAFYSDNISSLWLGGYCS